MMNWLPDVVFRPYGLVMIVATILALSTQGCCDICTFNKSCTSIVLFEGNYTGQVHPTMNSPCSTFDSSSTPNQKTCFLSFDLENTCDWLQNIILEVVKTFKNEIPNGATCKDININSVNNKGKDWLEKIISGINNELQKGMSKEVTCNGIKINNFKDSVLNRSHNRNESLLNQIISGVVNQFKKDKTPITPPCNSISTVNDSLTDQIFEELYNSFSLYSCTLENMGLWLSKENITEYKLKISRGDLRPTAEILFVRDKCNWTHNVTCRSTKINPDLVCSKAEYRTCNDDNANVDVIKLEDTDPVCYKCGSPLKPVESIQLGNKTLFTNEDSTTNKADEIKNLTLEVLELMGNKTEASVFLGEVQGIFVKPKDTTKLENISFVYSSETNLNIIQDKTQMVAYPRQITVPKEAFEKAISQNISTPFTAVFRFPNFTKDVNSTVLNDEVYSIEMGAKIANLTYPITLTFKNIDKTVPRSKSPGVTILKSTPNPIPEDCFKKAGTPSCLSWSGEGSQPNWTSMGCHTIRTGESVSCECEHLTFFAVLMIPNSPDNTSIIPSADLSNLTYITSIGCGLSVFFLCVALFMHFLMRRARKSESAQILINLLMALILLNLTFLTNEFVANTGNVIGCKLMAGFMHYCLLCTFTWFGLEALHLCLQLVRTSKPIAHYLIKIRTAGWVPPAIVVTVLFCMQKYDKLAIKTDTGNNVAMCWIIDPSVHYVVNIGYYSVIFAFTFTTFVVMLRWIVLLKRTTAGHRKAAPGSVKRTGTGTSDVLTIMGLCCTLGVTWGFAFFAYGALRIPSYYIFTILNSFQGFFLFIYYYNTSKLIGEKSTISTEHSNTTEAVQMENPYEKSKDF